MIIRTHRVGLAFGVVDDVDEPALFRRHGVDELTPTTAGIEHTSGAAPSGSRG